VKLFVEQINESDTKKNVARHMKKETSCGDGIKEIIVIKADISCEHCNIQYTTYPILKKHLKICKMKNKKMLLLRLIK
jgi:hypothetical protein